jgi:phage terminase small subunit
MNFLKEPDSIDILIRNDDIKSKLTDRERRFVDALLLKETLTAACQVANISNTKAKALLKKDYIKDYIEIRKEELAERYNVTQEYFVDELKNIVKEADDNKEKIDALELMAKITGNIKSTPAVQNNIAVLKLGD